MAQGSLRKGDRFRARRRDVWGRERIVTVLRAEADAQGQILAESEAALTVWTVRIKIKRLLDPKLYERLPRE